MKRKRLIIFGVIVIVLIFIYPHIKPFGVGVYVLINKIFFVLHHNSIAVIPTKYNLPITKSAAPRDEQGEFYGATPQNSVAKDSVVIPDNFLLNVSFTSQAPFGVWDPVHNDACEEAALVMTKYWVSGHALNAIIADKEILDAMAWEAKTWGAQYELTAARMAVIGKDFFGLNNIKVALNPTIDDIKSQLSQGNLILVPVAGRLLGNPYYRQPGPIYHILVIKGYNEQEFITNDAGTRRGEGYRYSYQTLFNAIHNWPYLAPDFGINIVKDIQAQKILTGQRAMLIISKN